ncbi:hypothetical protein [Cloacibacterium sp.]|uniref:hypothetical protein n=1 Tax=Cloacibacterium sp. TaxID=1913682 RepID=UPI0039E42FB9
MKKLLTILSFTIFILCFSQEKYVNDATAYYNSKSKKPFGYINNPSINEIYINSDNTFEMWMRPHNSCFTWQEFKGTWKKTSDSITFSNHYEVKEADSYEILKKNNSDKFTILFKNDSKKIIANQSIYITYEYDFDSKINPDNSYEFTTNKNGIIEIPINKIPNFDKVASLKYKFQYKQRKIDSYITESDFVNKKAKEIPKDIVVVLIENPKKETVVRTVKTILKDNKLYILSSNKTKTNIKDFHNEWKFEKLYTKE